MMISKLTQYSCWVTYNDLELVLFNYKLLIVVIKACETSMPNRSVVMTWWLGWMCCMVSCCHEPLFVVFAFSYAPGSRPYERKKISEANYFFYKFGLFFYKYSSTLIMFLFSSCTLCFLIHVLIIALLFFNCSWLIKDGSDAWQSWGDEEPQRLLPSWRPSRHRDG
jgi:hypothetical protein